MENQVVIISTKKDLEATLKKLISERTERQSDDFESEKLSVSDAAKLAGMSVPTFNRRVSDGMFKKYGSGRKVFFIKSEIIETLKSSAYKKHK